MLVHKENLVILCMVLVAMGLFYLGATITGTTSLDNPLKLDGKDIVLGIDNIPADSEIVLYVNNNLVSKTKLKDYLDEEGISYGLLKQAIWTESIHIIHLENPVRIPLSKLGYDSKVKKKIRVSIPGSNLLVEAVV